MNTKDYEEAWRMNIGPSIDNPDKFNHSIAIRCENSEYIIFGNVFWDDDLCEYIFYFIKQLTGPVFTDDYSQLILTTNEYSSLKLDIESLTGIKTLRGIYDETYPDGFYDENVIQLWEEVFCKELE
ncbi:MAG: hypothetical protein LR008_02500 [Candidatus Pacebacteria bacterium]|nr:hypothetical protein [Candidatus Paceibacterota bacterium]